MSLSIRQILILIGYSFLLAVGQILFKKGALTSRSLEPSIEIISLIFNPFIFSAITLYGVITFLWIYILKQVPLSLAYPFVALGFIFVPALAWLVFGDEVNLPYLLGVILIMVGISLIGITSKG